MAIRKSKLVKYIAEHEVFASLAAGQLKQLESIVDYIEFKEGETIYKINEQPNYLYYIIGGTLTVHFPNNTVIELAEGQLVGEVGILNGDFRTGTLKVKEDTTTVRICGTKLFDPKYVDATTGLIITRILGKRITDYLRSMQQTSTRELLLEGENDRIEFKSTLRWNIHSNKRDKAITHASLKTIAAYLNTDGGTLFVGVNDDAEILGLDADQFANEDKMHLFLTNTIKSNIGSTHLTHIHFLNEAYDGKELLRIDVEPGSSPAYVKYENDEMFYIRTGPSTTALRVSKIFGYIKNRFS